MFYAGPLIPEQAELPTSTFIDQVVRVFHIDIRDLGDALDQVLPRSQSYFMGTISSVFFFGGASPAGGRPASCTARKQGWQKCTFISFSQI